MLEYEKPRKNRQMGEEVANRGAQGQTGGILFHHRGLKILILDFSFFRATKPDSKTGRLLLEKKPEMTPLFLVNDG